MQSASDFYVFKKWLNASGHAFGKEGLAAVVPEDDREAYWAIYSEFLDAAGGAIGDHSRLPLYLRPKGYSRLRGSRGHRPVDLWVSICADGAALFGHMPQVYSIASVRGLEIGFAASIPEDDYYDPNVKSRNRAIVPLINAALPEPSSAAAVQLETALDEDGGWIFSTQTRLQPSDEGHGKFSSLQEMLHHLKTSGGSAGGGCIARYYTPQQVASVNLHAEFDLALNRFGSLLTAARPAEWDIGVLANKGQVEDGTSLGLFNPDTVEDGRKIVLAKVAMRQGQRKFRSALMKSYGGRCAVTGCDTPDVLQAAHIMPYLGPSTNHPTNGILLRGDIHTLFDLDLISIDPQTLEIVVSAALKYSIYAKLAGRIVSVPKMFKMRPSQEALQHRWQSISR